MSNYGQSFMPNNSFAPQSPMIYPDTNMYQQRLNNMAQQVIGQGQPNGFNYGFNPMQMGANGNPSMQGQTYNVRVVTGQEEAMASQTPLDGSVSILIDKFHNTIYTKQLNMNDGNPLVKRYKMVDIPQQPEGNVETNVENPVEYVEKSEFDEFKNKVDTLWSALASTPENGSKTTKKEANK